ncbi:6-pyruvoyl tetrahydrobiopterin synthase isoform X3 [Bombus pyrosoma]|nr:6-pyruvoyl tetrahydrobiopterin synthase isoform X3 [Bombus pyrosoma]
MMERPIAYLTRKEVISSCHRLHNENLTEEENKNIYGKCNNYWGHGHNYTVEVTVCGPVDPVTEENKNKMLNWSKHMLI